jgi:hypothetical protein
MNVKTVSDIVKDLNFLYEHPDMEPQSLGYGKGEHAMLLVLVEINERLKARR